MAKNTKELGNLIANRLRVGNPVDTGNSQIGTANPPNPVSPPTPPETNAGITIPTSEVGNVQEGDLITLKVVSNNGTDVNVVVQGIKKAKSNASQVPQSTPEAPQTF